MIFLNTWIFVLQTFTLSFNYLDRIVMKCIFSTKVRNFWSFSVNSGFSVEQCQLQNHFNDFGKWQLNKVKIEFKANKKQFSEVILQTICCRISQIAAYFLQLTHFNWYDQSDYNNNWKRDLHFRIFKQNKVRNCTVLKN